MTIAQVVETSVNVSNSPIQDYVHLDDHAQPAYEVPISSSQCNCLIENEG